MVDLEVTVIPEYQPSMILQLLAMLATVVTILTRKDARWCLG
jgi:hypothetical protein